MALKINIKSVFLYIGCGAAMAFLNFAVRGVPLSFALYFSMLLCGMNVPVSALLYIVMSAVHLNLTLTLLSLFEGIFCALIALLYHRAKRKMRVECPIFLLLSLTPYIVLAPWEGIDGIFVYNGYIMRAIAVVLIMLLTLFCFKSLYAVLFRIGRCRLREDELICLAVVYAAIGSGMYVAFGQTVYLGICGGLCIFFIRVARSPSAIIAAIVLSLPNVIWQLSLTPMTAQILICCAALVFVNAGKFASGIICAASTAGYIYLNGGFDCSTPMIVLYSALLILCCALPLIPSEKQVKNLKLILLARAILSDEAVNRVKRNTGERLYRISEVFREIERSFTALDEQMDEAAARGKILRELCGKVCANCEKRKRCERTDARSGLKKLIDAGCAKGRVSLIDLTSELTGVCPHPTDILSCLNGILADYRRCRIEAENARSGRKLLADQAHGVADVLKNCATELSSGRGNFYDTEEQIKKNLAGCGISCPELYISGENGHEASAVICGKFDIKIAEKVISDGLGTKMVLKDKINYDGDKSCYFFRSPPALDAMFGVAYAVKKGEKVSGDTHSVIKINERSFLMALSDGMGSGIYAQKVSEAAISLIEAFYRAEMPEGTVLKTINKLLSFNRDERFACIDIAAVNLDTGRADFVKIGSPAGTILREGEIKILESNSLPMGILENLRPAVCTEILKSGDIVVFMSDGITSAYPSAGELYEFLQGLHALNPQAAADKILSDALARYGGEAKDDMTVLCTRIFTNAE